MRTPRPFGFSLLRALMATAVLSGIVALFAAPRLMPAQQRRGVRAEAETFAIVLADARAQAVLEQVCVQVDIVPIDGRASILVGKTSCDSPLRGPGALPAPKERALQARGTLSAGLEVGGGKQLVRFSPNGTVQWLHDGTRVFATDDPELSATVFVSTGGALCIEVGDDPDCPEALR